MADRVDQPPCDCETWMRESVLAFDGGGIRGYASLLILHSLMILIESEERKHDGFDGYVHSPWEYFDYIFGTSTGGIIAIMLGRLCMTTEQCLDAYRRLGSKIFGKKRAFWKYNRYDHERLAELIKEEIEQYCKDPTVNGENQRAQPYLHNPADPGLMNVDKRRALRFSQCRVGVLAVRQDDDADHLHLFRSYHNSTPPTFDNRREVLNLDNQQVCFMWQTARATSAAPTFFGPMQIHNSDHLDGGLKANNPSFQAWLEVNTMHGQNLENCKSRQGGIKYFVSIGTGKGADQKIVVHGNPLRRLYTLLKTAANAMTNPEDTHIQMKHHFPPGAYYRFDVQQGLKGMRMNECNIAKNGQNLTLEAIDEAVRAYLREGSDAANHLNAVAKLLVEHRRKRVEAVARSEFGQHPNTVSQETDSRQSTAVDQTRIPRKRTPLLTRLLRRKGQT